MKDRGHKLLHTLVLLTSLMVFAQIALVTTHFYANQLLDITISYSLQPAFFYSKAILVPLIQWLITQCLLYIFSILIIWYLAISISELVKLSQRLTYYVGIFLWFTAWAGIITANIYFFHHSILTRFIRDSLFKGLLTDTAIKTALIIMSSIVVSAALLTALNLIKSLYTKQNRLRHTLVIFVICALIITVPHQTPANIIQTNQPNIILIGFDALRPDCIGENNICKAHLPYLNRLLQSSTQYTNAYTPLARTSSSWTSILTGKYPKQHGARDNDIDIKLLQLNETLPKKLKAAGYETFYATDDRRYNNINKSFGFDYIIGPPTGLNDFIIGTLNDFPLSNLLVFSPWGAKLFPYNYANHCASVTYNPDHFLQKIDKALSARDEKPIFLAVHFNVGSWPFHWYNDHQPDNVNINMTLYRQAIEKADQQLGNFLAILNKHSMLSNTIVVVLSDHGITLGLRNDRIISKQKYRGKIDVTRQLALSQYSNTPVFSLNFQRDYGLDTSYGYGGDVLSLKQNHALLAFKGYGINIGRPQKIKNEVLLIDITPTLLDYLSLAPIKNSAGLSLKNNFVAQERSFYFETGIKDPEIEKENISVTSALKNVIHYYQIDPNSGLVYIGETQLKKLLSGKQYAVLQGNWLLARYPASQIMKLAIDPSDSRQRILKASRTSSYFVLVNLKTQEWTMEWDTALARQAPLKELFGKLKEFYGNEIANTEAF